jgi:putative thiazole/oxazole-modified microcin (TOMM)-like peptide
MANNLVIDRPVRTAEIAAEWRFSELIADAWVEPTLIARYQAEPRTVLAEYGVALQPGEQPPTLSIPIDDRIVRLGDENSSFPSFCLCGHSQQFAA